MTIGDERTATEIATYHHNGDAAPDGWEFIASGSHRSVYVDYCTDTVYKVGLDGANRNEYDALTAARLAGHAWAPAVDIYEVTVTDRFGREIECTVIAMPYLPEDGSVEHDGVVIACAGAFDLNSDNVVANGGQLWLIDAGGL